MTRRLLVLSIAAAVLAFAAVPAPADVIFDNFRPGNVYDTGTGYTTGKVGDAFLPSMGFLMPSAQSGTVDEIDFAAGIVSGTNSVVLSLRSDTAGKPGATLESWTVVGLGAFGASNPPKSVLSVSHPTLVAGGRYWLTLAPGAADTWAVWNWNTIIESGPVYNTRAGVEVLTGDAIHSVFRVLGTLSSVPEPSSLVLAGTAALVLATGHGARRRHGRRPGFRS